ncbi:glycine betaine ABC transporter substrate-binding protein, partial [Ammoniphilus sp. 3BR4]|uniref:glycine betaine ABC transporter substrate-binding protein n=1 Tax=Ammoniphilus sp. 3BR4 TaxID=3158265 RepID=UPI00346705FD
MKYVSYKWLIILFILIGWLIPWEDLSYSKESSSNTGPAPASERAIMIGAKTGTISILLMKVTGIYLKDQGYTVKEITFADSKLLRAALEAGVIDLYWESTYLAMNPPKENVDLVDPDMVYQELMEEDRTR